MFDAKLKYVKDTIDTLGLALVEYKHEWTKDERWAYDKSMKILDEIIEKEDE
jgi:hypothetical protein